MKFFTLSIVVASLTLIGCGNDSKSAEGTPKNVTEVKTVKEAEKNLNAMSAFQSIDLSVEPSSSDNKILNKFTNKKFNKLQKVETVACTDSGSITYDVSEDKKKILYTFNKCQSGNTYIDGKMKFVEEDDNSIEIDYDKLTFKDVGGTQYMDFNMKMSEEAEIETVSMNGVINQTTKAGEKNNMKLTSFVIKTKETSDESWGTIDGTMEFESKCVTGTYVFETVEKLVDARDGSDNLESGTLKLNGATYTFDNPNVTIEAGSETETMLQSELDKRMEESSNCSI